MYENPGFFSKIKWKFKKKGDDGFPIYEKKKEDEMIKKYKAEVKK